VVSIALAILWALTIWAEGISIDDMDRMGQTFQRMPGVYRALLTVLLIVLTLVLSVLVLALLAITMLVVAAGFIVSVVAGVALIVAFGVAFGVWSGMEMDDVEKGHRLLCHILLSNATVFVALGAGIGLQSFLVGVAAFLTIPIVGGITARGICKSYEIGRPSLIALGAFAALVLAYILLAWLILLG